MNRLLDYGDIYKERNSKKQEIIPRDQTFKPATYKTAQTKKSAFLTQVLSPKQDDSLKKSPKRGDNIVSFDERKMNEILGFVF